MSAYEPPIFVCGLPRSGSTLLELRIAKSPEVLRFGEALFLSPWRKDFRYFLRSRVGDVTKHENLRLLVDGIFDDPGNTPGITTTFWRLRGIRAKGDEVLKRRILASLEASDCSLQSIFRILLEEITRHNGYRRCCVPFPVHISRVDTLMTWFPEAKFIHLTRDPRAIAVSKTNDPGGTAIYNKRWPYLRPLLRKAMMGFVSVQYAQAARVHEKLKSRPNYMLTRYEDMVMRPAEVMKQICAFSGIEFIPAMLEQTEDRAQRSSITGELRLKADPTAASNWMEVMTPFERMCVTAFTRSSMKRLEFDPESHPIYAPGLSSVSVNAGREAGVNR